MTNEEIKSKLALTEEQKMLVEKFNNLLKEMKDNKIGIVYDSCIDSMSFSAFNSEEVTEVGDKEWLDCCKKESIDIEDCIKWGNLNFDDIYEYDSFNGNLHASFK